METIDWKQILKQSFIVVIFPFLTGMGTFLITKAKYDTEVSKNELENVQTAIEIWKQMALDLEKKVNEQSVRINELEQEVFQLKQKQRK